MSLMKLNLPEILGNLGLLPFIALAAGAIITPEAQGLLLIQQLYGAVILAFVGALHWPFAMLLPDLTQSQRSMRYIYSVVPAIQAVAAMVMPEMFRGFVLAACLVFALTQDYGLKKQTQFLPDWYLPLRLKLTLVASICLVSPALVR